MFLHKGVKLLDTTGSLPGYRTVCPPLDKPFQLRTHLFTSFAAIRSYWRDLSCVCLNTPLGKRTVFDYRSILFLAIAPSE